MNIIVNASAQHQAWSEGNIVRIIKLVSMGKTVITTNNMAIVN